MGIRLWYLTKQTFSVTSELESLQYAHHMLTNENGLAQRWFFGSATVYLSDF